MLVREEVQKGNRRSEFEGVFAKEPSPEFPMMEMFGPPVPGEWLEASMLQLRGEKPREGELVLQLGEGLRGRVSELRGRPLWIRNRRRRLSGGESTADSEGTKLGREDR